MPRSLLKPVVAFDLDGVLSHFVRGALKAHGREDVPLSTCRWNLEDILGLTAEQFWRPLEDANFWASLDPMPDGMALLDDAINMAEKGHFHLMVLSNAGVRGSKEGKERWLKKHAPYLLKSAAFVNGPKWPYGGPHKLLIDDHDTNCRDWTQLSGGRAALVPRPWNDARGSCLSHPDPLLDGHDFDHAIDFGAAWLHELDHAENWDNPAFECVVCGPTVPPATPPEFGL